MIKLIIIFIIFIIFIISYLINKKNIEHITNLSNNDLENISSNNKFKIPNEISYENTESLSYMPNEIKCNNNLLKYPKKLNYNNHIYNLKSKIINNFYNQEYYLYEYKLDQDGDLLIRDNLEYLNEQLYNYILVYFKNNKIKIKYKFGPRNKIDNGDIIYIDLKDNGVGISYIGPFIIE